MTVLLGAHRFARFTDLTSGFAPSGPIPFSTIIDATPSDRAVAERLRAIKIPPAYLAIPEIPGPETAANLVRLATDGSTAVITTSDAATLDDARAYLARMVPSMDPTMVIDLAAAKAETAQLMDDSHDTDD